MNIGSVDVMKILVKYLDEAARKIEDTLRPYFPGIKFRFTHDEFSIHKQVLHANGYIPIIKYRPVKKLADITPKSYLLIIASVEVFDRKQVALVRCIVNKENEHLVLKRTREPVEILETEHFPEEEVEKKKGGLVRLPNIVREYQHEIVGALIATALNIALKMLGL